MLRTEAGPADATVDQDLSLRGLQPRAHPRGQERSCAARLQRGQPWPRPRGVPTHGPSLRLAKPEVPVEAGPACVGVGRGAAAGLPGNHHVHRLCLRSGGRRSPGARSRVGCSLRQQEGSVSRTPRRPQRGERCLPCPAVRGGAQESSKQLRAVSPQSVTVELRSGAFLLGPSGHRGQPVPSAWLTVRVRPSLGPAAPDGPQWHVSHQQSLPCWCSEYSSTAGGGPRHLKPQLSCRCSRALGGLSAP